MPIAETTGRIERVNQHAVQVMACRVQGKKLVIKSMGNPGDRMPVLRLSGGECPLDGAPRYAGMNVRIGGNIIAIVDRDK
jgi:hypothetical protein